MAWTEADLVTIGYYVSRPFPCTQPQARDTGIECVCIASSCCGGWPDDWTQQFAFNHLFVHDTIALAERTLPREDADGFLRFGLRTLPVQFGESKYGDPAWDVARARPEPIPPHFVRLGFDVCSRVTQATLECSPLWCNGYAAELRANRFCLLDTLEQAVAAADHFGQTGAEPGPYVVLEVWAERVPVPTDLIGH